MPQARSFPYYSDEYITLQIIQAHKVYTWYYV